jgi:hypothetical protein
MDAALCCAENAIICTQHLEASVWPAKPSANCRDELKHRDARIEELRQEIDEQRELIQRLREHAESSTSLLCTANQSAGRWAPARLNTKPDKSACFDMVPPAPIRRMEEHNAAHSTRVKVLHYGTVYVGFIKRHKRSNAAKHSTMAVPPAFKSQPPHHV